MKAIVDTNTNEVIGYTNLDEIKGYLLVEVDYIPEGACYYQDGRIVKKPPELTKDLLHQKRQEKLNSLLQPTDSVILKLAEGQIIGKDITADKTKYKNVLDNRQAIRQWNEQIKQTIDSASTQEDMQNILNQIESYQGQ
jgi:hypothetical protein